MSKRAAPTRSCRAKGSAELRALLLTLALLSVVSTQAENRLAGSKSRYLLQHASNPVDWYPWGEEAFARAKKENKPIFLSVGYSTCHWCRVMEEESFADAEIASLMNAEFIAVKVDREERPDIDSVYLQVTRTLTGEAGWPNNVILTPDGKPFFATSYVPKESFRALIPRIGTMWREKREHVVSSAELITASLRASNQPAGALEPVVFRKAYEQLRARFDATHGGFLPAPKFPSAHHLMFLLRYWKRADEPHALAMVETTLRAMKNSALWDRVGFGFHRYASDAAWNEPHYEKMLYDQAMLAMVNLEAYQATGRDEYATTARQIFTYVLRDLRSPKGSFYAAEDADEAYYTARDRTKLRRPGRDEKILADWNGLMIAALAFGASVLDEPRFAEAASRAADDVLARRRPLLDDHVFLVWGLLNLYEATFDVRWLEAAISVEASARKRFLDGVFYISPPGAGLLVRPREIFDGAIPSGNSVAVMNLVRLGRITADGSYAKAADGVFTAVSDEVSLAPSTAPHLLSAFDFRRGPSFEVVLAGKDIAALRRAVFAAFVPNKVVVHRPVSDARIVAIAPYTKYQLPIREKPTAYVCLNYMCRLPVTDPAEVWQ